MRRLVVQMFLTLDGVYQSPGGPNEDPSGGFTHGGWSANYWDEAMGQKMGESMGGPFDLLLGRKTYEIFAAHWPNVGEDHEDADAAAALNSATKWVASHTLDKAEWSNSHVLSGDVAQEVAQLKEQDGPEIQTAGSGNLIQTLLKHDLVDELRLWIFPMVLGTGKRLFADGTIPTALKVVDVTTSSTGVVMATYARGGEIDYGSFELEEPTE